MVKEVLEKNNYIRVFIGDFVYVNIVIIFRNVVAKKFVLFYFDINILRKKMICLRLYNKI